MYLASCLLSCVINLRNCPASWFSPAVANSCNNLKNTQFPASKRARDAPQQDSADPGRRTMIVAVPFLLASGYKNWYKKLGIITVACAMCASPRDLPHLRAHVALLIHRRPVPFDKRVWARTFLEMTGKPSIFCHILSVNLQNQWKIGVLYPFWGPSLKGTGHITQYKEVAKQHRGLTWFANINLSGWNLDTWPLNARFLSRKVSRL